MQYVDSDPGSVHILECHCCQPLTLQGLCRMGIWSRFGKVFLCRSLFVSYYTIVPLPTGHFAHINGEKKSLTVSDIP